MQSVLVLVFASFPERESGLMATNLLRSVLYLIGSYLTNLNLVIINLAACLIGIPVAIWLALGISWYHNNGKIVVQYARLSAHYKEYYVHLKHGGNG